MQRIPAKLPCGCLLDTPVNWRRSALNKTQINSHRGARLTGLHNCNRVLPVPAAICTLNLNLTGRDLWTWRCRLISNRVPGQQLDLEYARRVPPNRMKAKTNSSCHNRQSWSSTHTVETERKYHNCNGFHLIDQLNQSLYILVLSIRSWITRSFYKKEIKFQIHLLYMKCYYMMF